MIEKILPQEQVEKSEHRESSRLLYVREVFFALFLFIG